MMRQRYAQGLIAEVDLGDGLYAYARTLRFAPVRFFDLFRRERPSIEQILAAPILFEVSVMRDAITSGRWPIVARVPLTSEEREHRPLFFHKDVVDGSLYLTHDGSEMRPATAEECEGLERLAVWEAFHIEDRLRDHHEGRPNVWLDQMKR